MRNSKSSNQRDRRAQNRFHADKQRKHQPKKLPAHTKQKDLFDFTCPTPFKQMFRSEQEAHAFIELNHPDDTGIRPYACSCSSIHIGHSGTTRPESKIHVPVEVFRGRLWCPYPQKPGFNDRTDAYLYASTRYLPHHVEVFDCACTGVHFRISQEGQEYRRENLRLLAI